MTADYGFLAIYPYWGFQGLTRITQTRWRSLALARQRLRAGLNSRHRRNWSPASTRCAGRRQRLFLMRHGDNNAYILRLAKDIYPNQPNVKRYTVELDSALFEEPQSPSPTSAPSSWPSEALRHCRTW